MKKKNNLKCKVKFLLVVFLIINLCFGMNTVYADRIDGPVRPEIENEDEKPNEKSKKKEDKKPAKKDDEKPKKEETHKPKKVNKTIVGKYIAEFSINFFKNHAHESIYSWASYHRGPAYFGKKTSGVTVGPEGWAFVSFQNKYAVDCVGWVSMAIHQSTGLENEGAANGGGGFVTPQTGINTPYFEYVYDKRPGDILIDPGGPHVMVYVGNNQVVHSGFYVPGGGVALSPISEAYQTRYSQIARINDFGVKSINPSKLTTKFKGKGSLQGLTGDGYEELAHPNEVPEGLVSNYVRSFADQTGDKSVYADGKEGRTREKGYNNEETKKGEIPFDESSFVASMIKRTTGVALGKGKNPWTTKEFVSNAKSGNKLKKVGKYSDEIPNPADILCKLPTKDNKGRIAIYIGNNEFVEMSRKDKKLKISEKTSSKKEFDEIYRLKNMPNIGVIRDKVLADKLPDGTKITVDETAIEEFEYQGTTEGTFGYKKITLDWVINSLKDMMDWIIGATTYVIRMVVVGWTSGFEMLVDNLMEWIVGEEQSLTVEKLFSNKVPILDVNFFNLKKAGGMDIKPDSLMYIIRENIAMWYYIVRIISIVGLLLTLLYLGIRLAFSSIAEDKAKYKEYLKNWFVSFIIVIGIHYFMVFVLGLNDSFISLINSRFGTGELSLYDDIRSGSYFIGATVGWTSAVVYMVLVYLLIRFLFIYFKRFLVVAILTFMAPIIGVTYSIDMIKDNKSQSLSNWTKEYVFNVLIQSVHCLLYALFIGLAFDMLRTSLGGAILAVILLNFILKAEVIFKKIFGIKSGSLKDALKSTLAVATGTTVVKKLASMNRKAIGIVASPVTKPLKMINNDRKAIKKNEKILGIKNAIEEAKRNGQSEIQLGSKTYNVQAILNDPNLRPTQFAAQLLNNEEEIKRNGKAYIKDEVGRTLNTVAAGAEGLASIPMTIVDGAHGAIVGARARTNYKRGLSGYNKDKKKYIGRNLMTGGAYSQIRNLKKANDEHTAKLANDKINMVFNAQIADLKKQVEKEKGELKKVFDSKEVDKVAESASSTVSGAAIEKVLFNYSAKSTINIDAVLDKLEIDVQHYNEIEKTVKVINKKNSKEFTIDADKFKSSVNKSIVNDLTSDGRTESSVSNEEISNKFKSLSKAEKKKLFESALQKSIKLQTKTKKSLAKEKSGKNQSQVNEMIDLLQKNENKKVVSAEVKRKFDSLIADELIKNEISVTQDNKDKYISELTNEKLCVYIKMAASYKSSVKRKAECEKPEYKKLCDLLERINYYEAQKKG